MAKGELENRDAEELGIAGLPNIGELSEDLADERGELDSYSTRQLSGDVPADVQVGRSALAQAKRTGVGSPAIDYQVRSVYDSRPVNGRDFNLSFSPTRTSEAAQNLSALRRCFLVPRGLVAVIRGWTIYQMPGEELTLFDGTTELLVDNVVREPMTVRQGPTIDATAPDQEPLPYWNGVTITTFVVADENAFVGVNLVPNIPEPADWGDQLRVVFHGNFLQKTGVPAPFQIANKAGQAYSADTVSPSSLSRDGGEVGPSGADFLVRRRKRVSPYATLPLVNAPK